MPNWSEGSMKIRGKKQDVEKFLNEGLTAYKWNGDENTPIKHEPIVLPDEFEEFELRVNDDFGFPLPY